jgi:hypothetical protein
MMDRAVWFLGWLLSQKSLPLPLYVFAATCLFFLMLDLMADDRARAAISEWLKPRNVSVPATAAANAIRAVFDLFYALPLLFTARGRAYKRTLGPTDWTPFKAWWALVPSALIAVISTFVLTYYVFTSSRTEVNTTFWSGIAVNIISNYLALFVIRRWLFTDEANPAYILGNWSAMERTISSRPFIPLGMLRDFAVALSVGALHTAPSAGWFRIWSSSHVEKDFHKLMTISLFVLVMMLSDDLSGVLHGL